MLRMNGRARPTIRRAATALALLASTACTQARVDERQAMQITHGGRAELGPRWAEQYGCGGCHVIPGVPGARGRVGPPLGNVAVRMFVGGSENKPENLIAWIQDPQRVDSATAMPKTGVTERQARDIAAYLYTLAH
jgi:cytochrome c